MNASFFSELLQSISERGRALLDRTRNRRPDAATQSSDLVELCEDLLSGRGEASGVARARDILARYTELDDAQRVAFFEALATRFGPDGTRVDRAVDGWRNSPSDAAAAELHVAAEPRRQELFRRLNLAPGGTASLVKMREHLLRALGSHAELAAVDADFVHLFSSWFNRGFLVLRRIDWSTPASILEKIIAHEAVHKIRSWDDLRRRIDPPDRRCYAFFHPALNDEPLIFVEVALTEAAPGAIAPILTASRTPIDPANATTAVFYSISNCQRGLAGVTFGHFLIKQVAEDITRDMKRLSTFITLSPAPGFAAWLGREREIENSRILDADDRAALANLDRQGWWQRPDTRAPVEAPLMRAAAWYFLNARNARGAPLDPVARFHLGNGARLEQIHFLGDASENGIAQACGVMVNYLYNLDDIEKNHEAYAENRTIVASNAVRRMLRNNSAEIIPLAAG